MKLFSPSIAFLIAITVLAPFASAQDLFWAGGYNLSNTGSGQTVTFLGQTYTISNQNFNTASNWSTVAPNLLNTSGPGSVPGVGNIAVVQADLNNGTILGDFLSGITAVPVNINQTSQSNTVQGLIVSNVFLQGNAVNFTSAVGTTLTIAGTGASTGDFLVDGGVTLNYSGGPLVLSSGLAVVGDNANSSFESSSNGTIGGSGTLNIVSGSYNYDAGGTTTKMVVGLSLTGSGGVSSGAANGTVTQGNASLNTTSVVTLGSSLILGSNGGNGTWNVTNGSTLQTGTLASSYTIILGSNGGTGGLDGTGGSGTLVVGGTSSTPDAGPISTFDVGRSGSAKATDLQLGTFATGAAAGTTGGRGSILQQGNADVNIAGTATTVEIGNKAGGTGLYTLASGNLNIGTNATDVVAFTIGANGSTGTFTQTGGNLTVGSSMAANGTTFDIGPVGAGNGTYNMKGGVATFNNALTIDVNGTLALNGGVLLISAPNFASAGGQVGNLTFGGGTLRFTSGTTFSNPYGGGTLGAGTTSIIDASLQNLGTATANTFTTVTIPTLSGSGNLILDGTDGTNGNSTTTFALTGNTSTGTITIAGGVLNAPAADIETLSGLNITSLTNSNTGTSLGTVNLTLAAGGLAFTGALGGNGSLKVDFNAAGDTFAIQNENAGSFTGAIVLGADGVNHGNLQLYSGTFGNISETAAGSTLTVGGALPGGIPNGGNFTVPTSGAVTIGTATYTGLTQVDTGFALTVTGAGGILGSATVQTGAGLATPSIGGSLDNSGTTSVTGSGIAGSVTSNSGSLTATSVTGSVNGNTGTFTGASALGATTIGGSIVSNGTIASATPLPTVAGVPPPGAANPAAATFTTTGTISSSGTLVVRTNGIAADSYFANGNTPSNVSGAIALSGHGSNAYTIFTTPNSTINLGALTISSTTLFSGVVALNGTDNALVLTTTQIPSAQFAVTPTQRNVANVIDRYLIGTTAIPISSLADFTTFNNIYSNLAPGQFPAAQEQLSPTVLQYARSIAYENATYLAERVNNVDANLRSGYEGLDTSAVSIVSPGFGSGLGRSLNSLVASDDPSFHSAAPNGVNYYPGESGRSSPSPSEQEPVTPTFDSSTQVMSDTPNPYLANVHPGGPDTPKLSEFIAGDVILADLNKNGTLANAPSSSASYTAGGITAGVSYRVTNNFAAGVLFDYNHTDADTDGNGSRTKVDSYSPGVYATFFDKGFYANGLFSFGYNDYDNTRQLPTFGTAAHSSPSGQQYIGDLDVGYDFHPDKAWVVGPTLGATYTHLDIDSIQESGAGLEDLSINSQSLDSLRSRLGGHLIYQTYTGDVLLQPSLTAMWQHEFLASSDNLTSNFAELGSASTFTTPTAGPSRNSALIGVGLTATLSNSMALYLSYLADVGDSDFFSQSVIGGFKARF